MTTTTLIRNLGIAAHVDAGKTTLAERILFYTGRIHQMGETRGSRTPTLDHDKQERDRGITISAAATTCRWDGHVVNLVDTPGHVDFTVEVERAMRALDGAVLVLDAVAGVQAQTHTVRRQMDRYAVPFVAFVNKCDRPGAEPLRVVGELSDRLGLCPVAVQWPVGAGPDHRGVVDLVHGQLVTFHGPEGAEVRRQPVPSELTADVAEARERMLDVLSLHDDVLTEALLAGDVDAAQISVALRRATVARRVVPVLFGAAYRNLGVQPVLDAVVAWLPSPSDRVLDGVRADPDGPAAALAFKVVETPHGPVTWLRVLRGRLDPGISLVDATDGTRHRIRRLVQLHAGQSAPVDVATAGDVVAAPGLRAPTGATLCDPDHLVVVGAMHLPEPMVERRLSLVSGSMESLAKALGRLVRADPSLRVHTDPETGELRLTGMGELHLEVVARRLSDDHDLQVALGPPGVRGRLALGRAVSFDHLLSKQTGGPGMYARLVGTAAAHDDGLVFEWAVTGGSIPGEYRKAVEAGFAHALEHEGEVPVVGAHIVVTDGAFHDNDSSDAAFHLCARRVFREVLERAAPVRLEPVAAVEVEAPAEHHGAVLQSLLSRRGRVVDTEVGAVHSRVHAEVPISAMFGFSSTLRSATSGTGAYSMEFARFEPASA